MLKSRNCSGRLHATEHSVHFPFSFEMKASTKRSSCSFGFPRLGFLSQSPRSTRHTDTHSLSRLSFCLLAVNDLRTLSFTSLNRTLQNRALAARTEKASLALLNTVRGEQMHRDRSGANQRQNFLR